MTSDFHPHIVKLGKIGDTITGFITVAENSKMPFPIERVHWTYSTPESVTRGNHAHKNLKQILVAVAGRIKIDTETIDGTRNSFMLDSPDKGLFLPSRCWRTLHFSNGAVLMCLASMAFDEKDYIRDYEAFRIYRRQQITRR